MRATRRLFLTTCWVLSIAVIAHAQQQPPTNLFHVTSADAVFDNSVVHDISLSLNSQDWQTLKDHFLDDTYYPADIAIDDAVVRNVGIKSRGNGSRSGTKPGLKVDFSRVHVGSAVLRAEVARPQEQHAGSLEHARAPEYAAVRAPRTSGAARGVCPTVD